MSDSIMNEALAQLAEEWQVVSDWQSTSVSVQLLIIVKVTTVSQEA